MRKTDGYRIISAITALSVLSVLFSPTVSATIINNLTNDRSITGLKPAMVFVQSVVADDFYFNDARVLVQHFNFAYGDAPRPLLDVAQFNWLITGARPGTGMYAEFGLLPDFGDVRGDEGPG